MWLLHAGSGRTLLRLRFLTDSALPLWQKRKWLGLNDMSLLPSEADIICSNDYVR